MDSKPLRIIDFKQLPKLHRWVRLPSAAPKKKHLLARCFFFGLRRLYGAPVGIKMLGVGKAAPAPRFSPLTKALVRRKSAAGQKAGCAVRRQSLRNLKLSISTVLCKKKGHPLRCPFFFVWQFRGNKPGRAKCAPRLCCRGYLLYCSIRQTMAYT